MRQGGYYGRRDIAKAASQILKQRLDAIKQGHELISLVSQSKMVGRECPEMLPGGPEFVEGTNEGASVRMLLPTGRETDFLEG